MNVIIAQDDLNEILSVAGYPLISINDLEFGTNENSTEQEKLDNFKKLIIFPSLREFFKWFPITEIVEFMAEDSFSIDFPDVETFTVVDVRLNTAGFGVRDSVNPFVNNSVYRAVNTTSSYGGGMYGTKFDYSMREARLYDRMERQSLIDTNKAFRVDVDDTNRKVIGFSNIMGKIVITWAKYSSDFNKVPFKWTTEVIKLCKANLLDYLGNLRGMQISSLPNTFNYQLFLDRAKEYREEIIGKFKSQTKVVLIRG